MGGRGRRAHRSLVDSIDQVAGRGEEHRIQAPQEEARTHLVEVVEDIRSQVVAVEGDIDPVGGTGPAKGTGLVEAVDLAADIDWQVGIALEEESMPVFDDNNPGEEEHHNRRVVVEEVAGLAARIQVVGELLKFC